MQEELFYITTPSEQIDEQLRNKVRHIYDRGGNLSDFFKRLAPEEEEELAEDEPDFVIPAKAFAMRGCRIET